MIARPAAPRLEDAGVREARRVADLATAAYREHVGQAAGVTPCMQCHIATGRRNPGARCATGARLDAERREAAAALRSERAAAAAPNPDQEPLFSLDGAR